MKDRLFFIFFFIIILSLSSKAQFSKYIIRLKDKIGTPYSINDPLQFLSERSIERRTRQKISIDETDLPITPAYIDSILSSGNVVLLNKSKWLNQVCIQTTDDAALAKINTFSFVLASQPLMRPAGVISQPQIKFKEDISNSPAHRIAQRTSDYFDYGSSYNQIHIHEGEFLHDSGYTGKGMLLAIIDDGFYHYQTITAFDSVRNNNQIAETYDFVDNEASVNEDDAHGMECFSTIAGNLPGQLVGSCPEATFYLYRTENAATEYPIEEQNWVAAAERADSIGVDVFSTSLGYNQFDNSIFDHTYADLDGNTTIIAKGCDLAAKKGIISVVAAGNEGNHTWHFITTPADADSNVAVGSVNASGVPSSFSSYGPSSDGQVKPTVASIGEGTAIINTIGQPVTGNGTSFATPNMAGLITCLWQAFPDFTNMEIIEAVKKSSATYSIPDDRIGYGIPNFHRAFDDLTQQRKERNTLPNLGADWLKIYPNPAKGSFTLLIKPQNSGTATLKLFDAAGKLYLTRQQPILADQEQSIKFDNLQSLAKGVYTLRYDDGKVKKSTKVIVQ